MHIDINYSGVHLTVDLKSKVTVIRGNSGVGKTFLIKILDTYCYSVGLRSKIFNVEDLYNVSSDKLNFLFDALDFVFLDNADVYLTQEMYDFVVNSGKYCIIIMHSPAQIDLHDCLLKVLVYEGKTMRLGGD